MTSPREDLACVVNGHWPVGFVGEKMSDARHREGVITDGQSYCERCGQPLRITKIWGGMRWKYHWNPIPEWKSRK